jgi:hypothetical protein
MYGISAKDQKLAYLGTAVEHSPGTSTTNGILIISAGDEGKVPIIKIVFDDFYRLRST